MTIDFKYLYDPVYRLRVEIINASGGYWHPTISQCRKILGEVQNTCAHPNKQASTCGFESCPDCGARLEED